MAVLERQAGGAWKWDWVIANSDQPMPGATADGAEEQALMEIERGFVAAAKNRDVAYFERTLAKDTRRWPTASRWTWRSSLPR